MTKDKGRDLNGSLKISLANASIQRLIIAVLTLVLAFIIVLNGATPKKYRFTLNMPSEYDINAPRDIINSIESQKKALEAAAKVDSVMREIRGASIEVLESLNVFLSIVRTERMNAKKTSGQLNVREDDSGNSEIKNIILPINEKMKELGFSLLDEQLVYLIFDATEEEIYYFESVMRNQVGNIMKKDITDENLAARIIELQNSVARTDLEKELKNVGMIISNSILMPNRAIDAEATIIKKDQAYNDPKNIVKIEKGQRIISVGDIVTDDKLEILTSLNFSETDSRFDFSFAASILVILILLAFLLILYMNNFCKKVLYNRNDLLLLSIVILLTLLIARWVYGYSTLVIPIFLATMLVSILLNVKLALIVNLILTIAISIMTNGEIKFIFMAVISGSFSAFLVSKANQRNKLTMAGGIIALINVVVIIPMNLMYKSGFSSIIQEGSFVLINGFVSTVCTIGLLPSLESTFNIITPMRLLELGNPNQPLLKRLLTEAPGTYHHSLMVGNLAEVGAEAIGGNAMLARVGAYFHDIGKLKRPNFFTENQLTENPHDRMTPNLSALVITSHVSDGAEMAKKYKIPLAITDIIIQHHGTTLVAYFYHKAKTADKSDNVDESKFRYEGKKPTSKEAAVVMLADSVEAAVRSMPDKTEGKIEGLIRKIIKDKLNDGQLDHCELTLKDLDNIAKSFIKVFSGFFHAREEYPDIRKDIKKTDGQNEKSKLEETQDFIERE